MPSGHSTTEKVSVFEKVLISFERSLEQPLVPGELISWSEAASEQAENATAFVLTKTLPRLSSILKQTNELDADLANRVANLSEQNDSLEDDARQLVKDFREFAEKARVSDCDEAGLIAQRERLAKRGVAWVIDVRKLESAVATWFQEALSRDRGIGD